MMLDHDLKEKMIENGIVSVDPENLRPQGFYIEKAKELTANLETRNQSISE
jgi:hypothetical protein